MKKKTISEVAGKNITFLILTMFATVQFIMDIANALYAVKYKGTLCKVTYTAFSLNIEVTNDILGFHEIRSVFNFPLILILVVLLYNIYIIVRDHRNK